MEPLAELLITQHVRLLDVLRRQGIPQYDQIVSSHLLAKVRKHRFAQLDLPKSIFDALALHIDRLLRQLLVILDPGVVERLLC